MHPELPPHDLVPDDWAVINETLGLSPRELEVVQFLCADLPRKAIAAQMQCSRGTVDKEIERAYKKAKVHGRMELLLLCQDLARKRKDQRQPENPGNQPKRRKK